MVAALLNPILVWSTAWKLPHFRLSFHRTAWPSSVSSVVALAVRETLDKYGSKIDVDHRIRVK